MNTNPIHTFKKRKKIWTLRLSNRILFKISKQRKFHSSESHTINRESWFSQTILKTKQSKSYNCPQFRIVIHPTKTSEREEPNWVLYRAQALSAKVTTPLINIHPKLCTQIGVSNNFLKPSQTSAESFNYYLIMRDGEESSETDGRVMGGYGDLRGPNKKRIRFLTTAACLDSQTCFF